MLGSEKPDAHILITHFTLSSEMQRSQTGAQLQAATNALSKGGGGCIKFFEALTIPKIS